MCKTFVIHNNASNAFMLLVILRIYFADVLRAEVGEEDLVCVYFTSQEERDSGSGSERVVTV